MAVTCPTCRARTAEVCAEVASLQRLVHGRGLPPWAVPATLALLQGVVDALYAVVEGPPDPATRPRGDRRSLPSEFRGPFPEPFLRPSSGRSPAPSWRPWQGRRQWQGQGQGWQAGRQRLQRCEAEAANRAAQAAVQAAAAAQAAANALRRH